MGFNSVYRVLQQLFPQVDSPTLRDVAIKHSNDAGAAVEVVAAEVVPNLGQICSTELLDIAIEDARNNKKTLVSTMDSVISLMREVECKEKAAEHAKTEAARSSLDILAKVDELKQAQKHAKEANGMHAREVYGQKAVLASEMKEVQLRVVSLLDEGDRSLGVLDEMCRSLEMRFTAALIKKKAADQEKLEKEMVAQETLAYQESQMEKEVEESKRLKREAEENSKLQEFLKDCGSVVDTLYGEISVKCHDVNCLKEKLDQTVLQSRLLYSSETSSILASSRSFLTTATTPCDPQPEIVDSCTTRKDITDLTDSYVFLERGSGIGLVDYTNDTVPSGSSVVFADHQSFPENSTLNLGCQEGNNNGVTEKSSRPTQNMLQRRRIKEESNHRKCNIFTKGIQRRTASSKEVVIRNKRNKSGTKNLNNEAMKKWIEELIMDAAADYCQDDFDDSKESLSNHSIGMGVSLVTSLALAIHYPTITAAPHILINGYKNALAIAVETDYSFPLADKVKDYLEYPSKFAMGLSMVTSLASAIQYPIIASVPHMLINGYKNALAIAIETDYSLPLAEKVKE